MTHVQSRDRLFIRLSSFKFVFKNDRKKKKIITVNCMDYKSFCQSLRQSWVKWGPSSWSRPSRASLSSESTQATDTERVAACLPDFKPACGLWHYRRNLSGESARNAAPNSSLKLLRVLLQVKLGARLVNSVHQQRLLSFNLSKYSYDICKSSRYEVNEYQIESKDSHIALLGLAW